MPEELAPMKAQIYPDPRDRDYFARFHERTRTREPDWVYEAVRTRRPSTPGRSSARARSRPTRCRLGPGDPRAEPLLLHGPLLPGPVHPAPGAFMAKSQLFKPPMQWIYTHGGVFPVRRGPRDDDAFLTAQTILARGGRSSCTARAAARAPARCPTGPRPASAAWRSRRARPSFRSRSTAPHGSATGSACGSPGDDPVRRPDPLEACREPDASTAGTAGGRDLRRMTRTLRRARVAAAPGVAPPGARRAARRGGVGEGSGAATS